MTAEVVIRAVVYAVEFAPADGEEILDVARRFRVMGELVVILIAQMRRVETEIDEEIPCGFF